ncbi:DUF588 domain-containing protein [Cephalotus follicularis]|uniref:CASP-like protein n=1 Tax=Cephalotus follicularis TaxID=3775 RepID=A0A1Q3C686_CEPFO|nr:DUF588 domain-containing protein [Cephalotus follicularis]
MDSITKTNKIITILLRLVALAATIPSIVVMVISNESTQIFDFTFSAQYDNLPTFTYFVVAEAIAAGYSFIVIFLSLKSSFWRVIIILDVVVTLLLTSSVSATLAVALIGKNGNTYAGWDPICGQFSKFCDYVAGAVSCGFVATIIYVLIVLYDLHILSPFFNSKP